MAPTIFIHPKEEDRIRAQAASIQLRLRETAGSKRTPQDAHALRSAAIYADLMADFSGPRSTDVTTLIIREPYPPCLVALADLEPITLSELRMATHHRGRVLSVTKASPVVKRPESSWAIVKDEGVDCNSDSNDNSNDGERLELYLHQSLHSGVDLLEAGETFHIKEPFFTLNDRGEQTVRVDHPCDLVVAGGRNTNTLVNTSPSKKSTTDVHDVNQSVQRGKEQKLDNQAIMALLSKSSKPIPLLADIDASVSAGVSAGISVQISPGRGRGLFATRALPFNAIVLAEKAFCIVPAHSPAAHTALFYSPNSSHSSHADTMRAAPLGLHRAVMQKLMANPSQVEEVLDLDSGEYAGIGKKLILSEEEEGGGPVLDAFQVAGIVARNAFGAGGEEDTPNTNTNGAGLYLRASYINHSCLPNLTHSLHNGTTLIIRALRPIAAGEELFHAYTTADPDLSTRRAALALQWGFVCACALCLAETADGAEIRAKRQKFVEEARRFVASEPAAAGAKRLTVVRGRRLANAIGATYDGERYREVPRMGMGEIERWLKGAPGYR